MTAIMTTIILFLFGWWIADEIWHEITKKKK